MPLSEQALLREKKILQDLIYQSNREINELKRLAQQRQAFLIPHRRGQKRETWETLEKKVSSNQQDNISLERVPAIANPRANNHGELK